MKVNVKPKSSSVFNAFNLFFIIIGVQIGVGLPGFSRIIYKEARQDAWISVILAGILSHIIVYVMIKLLESYQHADLYGIHQDVFGNMIGKLFSIIYIIYFTVAITVVFRAYIEIVQAWLFPEIPTWLVALFGITVMVYGVLGGIRLVVGAAVFVFFFTTWLALLLYFPLQYAEWYNILPILDMPIKNILKGSYQMTFTIVGFEILFFFYPYVKEKEKVAKYSHLALLFTNLLYTAIMVISIVYFSGEQLLKTIWAVLSFFKIVQFPFIERFEIIAISLWMFIVTPNVLLMGWAASRGFKRLFNWKQAYGLLAITPVIFIGNIIFEKRVESNMLFDYFSKGSFYLVFIYPIILYGITLIKKKIKGNKKARRAS